MMNRKTKTFGLTVVAVIAINALMGSVAQGGSFDIGASPAILTGHSEVGTGQIHVISVERTIGSQFNSNCDTASFEGVSTGQSNVSELTVTPTYGSNEVAPTGCTLFGQAAQVRVNGCKYTITGAGQAANTSLLDVVGCTAATPFIQIKSALCEIRIPEQNGLSHLVGSNLVSSEVTLSTTVTGVTVHQIGAACPDGNGHKGTKGKITGNTIVKARIPISSTQVTKHGHQYVENKCGAQVSLVST
jgi:hypothetical protein